VIKGPVRDHAESVRTYLIHHPLFEMLKGKPLPLSMTAFQALTTPIHQIYQMSLSTLASMVHSHDTKEKLILGLELAFNNLSGHDSARDILFLIG
jgi:hypothetical protein